MFEHNTPARALKVGGEFTRRSDDQTQLAKCNARDNGAMVCYTAWASPARLPRSDYRSGRFQSSSTRLDWSHLTRPSRREPYVQNCAYSITPLSMAQWVPGRRQTMISRKGCSQSLRVLLAVGVSSVALCIGFQSLSEVSEIDSYEAAIKSQDKTEALHFIKDFSSSHLVGDLIESLKPEIAQQVCADLQGSGPAKVREACEAVRAAAVLPAAGPTVVEPPPAAAPPPADVARKDEPESDQTAGTTVTGEPDLYYPPVVARTPAANGGTVGPASTGSDRSTTTSVPPRPKPEGDVTGSNAAEPDLSETPGVATAPVGNATPVGTTSSVPVTSTSASTPPDQSGQDAEGTASEGGTTIVYPLIAAAPAAGGTAAPAASAGTSSSISPVKEF